MEIEKELTLTLSFNVGTVADVEEAKEELEERFKQENKTAEDVFWNNLELEEAE